MKTRMLTLVTIISLLILPLQSFAQDAPLTRAESSNYTETSLYSDVINFIQILQKKSNLFRIEKMGTSAEGRDIPLIIMGNPVPVSPAELKYDNRPVIYIQANIHAGEVEGKEASLMLARDILLDENPPFLDDLVILIAPIYNCDGNDKLGNNRRDKGPELAGVRHNGRYLDLNRDGLKIECAETQGLLKRILLVWDPILLIDCHTTNGSYHDEPVTYLWPLNPNGSKEIIEYMRSKMMPAIRKHLKDQYETLSIPYGNFIDSRNPEKGWRPAGPEPRYITNYIGIRNRFSILLENYAYADFKTRVWGNYYFLRSVLEYCSSHKKQMTELISNADLNSIRRGLHPAETDSFAIEYELKPMNRKITILGYELEPYEDSRGRQRMRKTDIKAKYTVPLMHDWVAKRSVRFPPGYFLPVNDRNIIQKLRQHGILVEKLIEPVTLSVESFQITELKANERLYQGHHLNKVKGEYAIIEKKFPIGTYFISTAQPLGILAAYLLEPESNDGLLAWNFLDRYLVSQWRRNLRIYPVYKALKPVNLVKESIH